MKILIIEDSPRLRRSLGHGLTRLGHAVDLVSEGSEGYDYARFNDYDVIVLDLMLPGMDGLTLLRKLRAAGKTTHILILSAKDRVEDRVRGLELGADDYLIKPFSFEELHARLGSLVRRRYEHKDPTIKLGRITINTATREVTVDGQAAGLTHSEYAILEYLALNRGRVRSKEQILDALRNGESYPDPSVVEVLVCTLRKKIRSNGDASVIKTRRGFGYLIE